MCMAEGNPRFNITWNLHYFPNLTAHIPLHVKYLSSIQIILSLLNFLSILPLIRTNQIQSEMKRRRLPNKSRMPVYSYRYLFPTNINKLKDWIGKKFWALMRNWNYLLQNPLVLQKNRSGIPCFQIYLQGDRITSWLFLFHLLFALLLSSFYNTWNIAVPASVIIISVFFISHKLLPRSFITRCMAGICLECFAVLYIVQMHGLAEMHFYSSLHLQ